MTKYSPLKAEVLLLLIYCRFTYLNSFVFMKELRNIAEKLGYYIHKEKFVDGAAAFTHYVSNWGSDQADFYQDMSYEFIRDVAEELDFRDELGPEYIKTIVGEYRKNYKLQPAFPHREKTEFTFIDLFAGIGGFRSGASGQGGKSVFSSEWDKYSKKTYLANYGELPSAILPKLMKRTIPDHNILLAGFPCQPFSLAGVSKKNSLGRNHGFLDETQGTLFFDIARILKEKRPKAFILENVKNLRSHDKGKNFCSHHGNTWKTRLSGVC